MTVQRELGKIISVRLGFGGRNDDKFGLTVEMQGPSWGTCAGDLCCVRADPFTSTGWDNEGRRETSTHLVRHLVRLLTDAKVNDVSKLVGKPVEVTFVDNTLKEWRILTEVL